MRIKNIKKFVRSILIILGLALLIVLLIERNSYSKKEIEYKTICVSEGDTLWSIAKFNQESNAYYNGKDIRFIIDDIVRINDLTSSNIRINQNLDIPVL